MNIILKRLPMDIVSHIISYTYQFQNKQLLDDILNYHEVKQDLFTLYPLYYRDWLFNDMFAYANHYKSTVYGYVDTFYAIFKRNSHLKTNESIKTYLKQLGKKEVSSQINILLGLFNIHEREDLLADLYNQELYFDEW